MFSPGVAETRCWLKTTSGEWELHLGRCERFFAPFLAVTIPWNSVCLAHAQGQSTQRRRRSFPSDAPLPQSGVPAEIRARSRCVPGQTARTLTAFELSLLDYCLT